MALDMDGREIRVGDNVGFKDDVEQYGRVVSISGGYVQVNVWCGETGEYEARMVSPRRCWKED